jgi:hypothetical protein
MIVFIFHYCSHYPPYFIVILIISINFLSGEIALNVHQEPARASTHIKPSQNPPPHAQHHSQAVFGAIFYSSSAWLRLPPSLPLTALLSAEGLSDTVGGNSAVGGRGGAGAGAGGEGSCGTGKDSGGGGGQQRVLPPASAHVCCQSLAKH